MDKNIPRYNVQLYIYDLSRGMARSLSPIMLGKLLLNNYNFKKIAEAEWPKGDNMWIIYFYFTGLSIIFPVY